MPSLGISLTVILYFKEKRAWIVALLKQSPCANKDYSSLIPKPLDSTWGMAGSGGGALGSLWWKKGGWKTISLIPFTK